MDRSASHDALTPDSLPREPRVWSAALLIVVLIAGFHLLREKWNRSAGTWPSVLLLAFPMLHLLHGHERHGKHCSHRPSPGQE